MLVSNRLLLLSCCFLFSACGKLEFSPNQKFSKNTPEDLNAANIQKIQSAPADDTIRFVLSGDPQRAYDQAEEFVKAVNKLKGVDFVVLDGDISDFGLLQEMEWVNKIYNNLQMPYIAVIGNHDLLASGEDVFRRMYGPLNFSFVYQGIKFVCHNTNSREYAFNGNTPDIPWLMNEFKPQAGVSGFIGLAHVPPFDSDFDQSLKDQYTAALNLPGTTLGAFYAHIDKTTVVYPDEEGTPLMTVNSIGNKQYLLAEIIHGRLHTQIVDF